MFDVDCGGHAVCGLAEVLSAGTGEYTEFLHVAVQKEDHRCKFSNPLSLALPPASHVLLPLFPKKEHKLTNRTKKWFFIAVLLQNYFLSAPYGRNWLYLWSSQHAPAYSIAILIILFFILIWALLLHIFSLLSTSHSWILPLFAIGLGSPRWAQLLWSTSNIGSYLPWAGGPIASALAGRALWLWLGTLDALQGVGFGMMLLQTLTRFHVLFTLLAAQVLGSVATILARATAPDKVGPGDVFPDFSADVLGGLGKGWFWVGLASQIAVPVGFAVVFRKEQLSKP